MSRIFLCYRREESSGYAGRIYDRVRDRFGAENVYMDVADIRIGVDFVKGIRERISGCDACVVFIGPNWLEATDERGHRRIDDPDDFVRAEISAALKQSNVLVIPALLDGAQLPSRDQLPADIRDLTRRNGLEISHGRFDHDVDRLMRGLAAALAISETTLVSSIWRKTGLVAMGLAVTIGILFTFGYSPREPEEEKPDAALLNRPSGMDERANGSSGQAADVSRESSPNRRDAGARFAQGRWPADVSVEDLTVHQVRDGWSTFVQDQVDESRTAESRKRCVEAAHFIGHVAEILYGIHGNQIKAEVDMMNWHWKKMEQFCIDFRRPDPNREN